MKNLLDITKKKNFKKGMNATILTIIMLAVIILVNLVAIKLDLKVDLTKNKTFSLSKESVKYIEEIKEPIKVTMIYPVLNTSNSYVEQAKELVKQISQKNNKITVETIDPSKNPMVLERFSKYGVNEQGLYIVIEKGDKGKAIEINELYRQSQQSLDSLAEQKVLTTMLNLQKQNNAKTYLLEGHGEKANVLDAVTEILKQENYEVQKLNLLTKDIPEDAQLVLLVDPIMDYRAEELVKLDKFFKGGKAGAVILNPSQTDLPQLSAYLKEWGLAFNNDHISELDPNSTMQVGSDILIPTLGEHEMTKYLKENNLSVFLKAARSINVDKNIGKGIEITPILTTSSKALGIKDFEKFSDKDANKGPMTVAAAVTRPYENNTAKLLAVGSIYFLAQNDIKQGFANQYLLINSLNWLTSQENQVGIMAKQITRDVMTLNAMQINIFGVVVLFVIPIGIIIFAIVVWLRRRHL